MEKNQKFLQIKELSSMIVDLKKNKSIDSKKTIQKLQQQIEQGLPEDKIRKTWMEDLETFKIVRSKYLIYD